MNRVTAASIAFLVFAIAMSAWLLLRPSAPPVLDDAPLGVDPRSSLTFAEWSVRDDGALLADIDPGKGVSTDPRSFQVVQIKRDHDGPIQVVNGPSFSWAAADRAASAGTLFGLGFRVNVDGIAFNPPTDPLWSDPIVKVDGGTEQTVTLRAKTSGIVTTFVRHRAEPQSAPFWNRRAIGFASSNGRMVYITPDAIVVPASPVGSPP